MPNMRPAEYRGVTVACRRLPGEVSEGRFLLPHQRPGQPKRAAKRQYPRTWHGVSRVAGNTVIIGHLP